MIRNYLEGTNSDVAGCIFLPDMEEHSDYPIKKLYIYNYIYIYVLYMILYITIYTYIYIYILFFSG